MSKPQVSKPEAGRPATGKPEERPRLGRGLAALIGEGGQESQTAARARGQKRVPIAFLRANPLNPRLHFDEEGLSELADSIRERGIIQPILVRGVPGTAEAYEIVAGERRWRAAQRAGLHDVPIVTIEADDRQALEIAIIENVQRTNLNAMEEAEGYERLAHEFGYSQGDLARVIGKSRPYVANTVRLLKLTPEVRALLTEGAITAGHARALLGATHPEDLARRIVAHDLSVRAVEELVKAQAAGQAAASPSRPRTDKDADTRALEKRIADRIGLAIDIRHKGDGGEVKLKYATLEQLDRLVELLGA